MKKIYFFSVSILFLLIMSGCFGGAYQSLYPKGHFDAQYEGLLGNGSKMIESHYNHVFFRTKDGHFLHRTYFPSTKQMTSETNYMTRHFSRKHGSYKLWYDNGNLKFKGKYEYDFLIGFAQYFHWETGAVLAEGNYSKSLKTGTWKYYDTQERLSFEINYKKGVVDGDYVKYDTLGHIINSGGADDVIEQIDGHVSMEDALPYLKECLEGSKASSRIDECTKIALNRSIFKIIEYPTESREYGVQGKALVYFTIDENGKMIDLTIQSGLDKFISQELYRIFEELKKELEWEAAKEKGKAVQSNYFLHITFRLE